jgi:hypothetical protein
MQTALPASRPEPAAAGESASSRWGSVLALAGLHGAVTIAWVVYNLYVVELLVRAGFDAYLATVLLTVEGLAGSVLEPLSGSLSDRTRSGLFRRFFLVMGGVVVASLLFVALPLVAVSARPGPATLLPALLIAWSCAMAVFRAPALSLLGRYARPGSLPLAASVLTAAAGLVGAAAPAARAWLLSLGPMPTFAAASAALLLSALVVRAMERGSGGPPLAEEPAPTPDRAATRAAWFLFLVGTSASLAFRFLVDGLPRAGAGPGAAARTIVTAFFLGTAVASIPLGRLALGRLGGGPVTAVGLAALIVGVAVTPMLDRAGAVLLCAALLGAALAAVQNGLFAYSLSAVRIGRAGLGMGLLLGGSGLALGLFNLLLAVRRPAPATSLLAAAGFYALTLLLLPGVRAGARAVARA